MSQLFCQILITQYCRRNLCRFTSWIQIALGPINLLAAKRSEPSSRAALTGEQPNPWELLHPQDATSRHRGAEPGRRCGLLDLTSLLSPE